jgi:Trk K+ transport system NAD-binding subunit/Kef-type K+ transport system membrane component KefB
MNIDFFIIIVGFGLVAIAGNQIAKVFQKIKFPLITGLIVTGIIAGSSVLNFIPSETLPKLNFLNNLALAIIAFSAGAELYIDDLRSRLLSIKWMTIGQLVITLILSSSVIFFFSAQIPFMEELSSKTSLIVAILFGVIFVARSPSSAIAVINELRANGPFTKTAMGVTVVKDVLVIILFSICFSIAKSFVNGDSFGISFLLFLFIELFMSFFLGVVIGKILDIPLSFKTPKWTKGVLIIIIGFGVYLFSSLVKEQTGVFFGHEVLLEPLLICIIGSFYVTNYTKNRIEFIELLEGISPTIYIVFFTLTGASLSLQTLVQVFWIAVAFFVLRIFAMFLGGVFGVIAANDNKSYLFISWMPYVTQAGVALGLTTIIAAEFPEWGYEFQTIIIAIIVINQLVGPPLFKWSINYTQESHLKHKTPEFDGIKDVTIFGLESQSIALALTLKKGGWIPTIVSLSEKQEKSNPDLDIIYLKEISLDSFKTLSLEKADAIVCLLSDQENYNISNIVYESYGTKDIIVRYNGIRKFYDKFIELGVRIIDPSLAMINLLDHFVRSPNATSILLGLDKNQDSIDVQIRNNDLHGMTLRDLRFPSDVIVLSVIRNGQVLISHGFTRLRLGDVVTLVGTKESVDNVRFKLES